MSASGESVTDDRSKMSASDESVADDRSKACIEKLDFFLRCCVDRFEVNMEDHIRWFRVDGSSKSDKKRKALSHLITQYNSKLKITIKLLIEIYAELFRSFEAQFVPRTKRNLQIISDVLVNVMIEYMCKNGCDLNDKVILDVFKKLEENITNLDLNKDEKRWAQMLSGVGIVNDNKFYKSASNPDTNEYGYRRLLPNETLPLNLTEAECQEKSQKYNYILDETIITRQIRKNFILVFAGKLVNKLKTRIFGMNNVEKPIGTFVGRNTFITKIKDNFELNKKLIVITGLSGVGKSETCREFRERYKSEYINALWFNCHTKKTLEKEFKDVIAEYIELPEVTSNTCNKFIVTDFYKELRKFKSLVIFDNVQALKDIRSFLITSTDVASSQIHTLITSQTTVWENYMQYNLEELGDKEAEQLVSFILGIDCSSPLISKEIKCLIKKLASILGKLPLALQQAGTYIREIIGEEMNNENVEGELSDYITNFTIRLKEPSIFQTMTCDNPKTVFVSMHMSLEKLEEIRKDSIKILLTCSLLNSETISSKMLETMFDTRIVKEAMLGLKAFSLVKVESSVYKFHSLVLKIAKNLYYNTNIAKDAYKHCLVFILHLNIITVDSENKYILPNEITHTSSVLECSTNFADVICDFYNEQLFERKCQLLLLLTYFGCFDALKTIVEFEKESLLTITLQQNVDQMPVCLLGAEIKYNNIAKEVYNNRYIGPASVIACIQGHENILKYFIEKGSSVNGKTNNEFSLLHAASHFGQLNIVKYLLSRGADLKVKDKGSSSVLHEACISKRYDIVDYLLTKNFMDVNDRNSFGETLLHNILTFDKRCHNICETYESRSLNTEKYGRVNKAYDVIKKKSSELMVWDSSYMYSTDDIQNLQIRKYVDKSSLKMNKKVFNFKNHPFTYVDLPQICTQNALEISTRILVHLPTTFDSVIEETDELITLQKKLISYNALVNVTNNHGQCPLHFAAAYGLIKSASYLISINRDVNMLDKNGMSPIFYAVICNQLDTVKLLLNNNADQNIKDKEGKSIFHYACEVGNMDTVKYLLEKGLDACVKDSTGVQPVHHAAAGGHVPVLECLLNSQIDITVTCKKSFNVLHFASQEGKVEVIKWLIDKKFNVNATTEVRYTALHLACKNGHDEAFILLVENKNIDVNALAKFGVRPIHSAAWGGNVEMIKKLLKYEQNIMIQDENGFNVLHYASWLDKVEMVRWLIINKQMDVNTRTKDGLTVLHIACMFTHVEVVKVLLEHEANVNILANEGSHPLHAAAWGGNVEIIEELLKYEQNIMVQNEDGWNALHFASAKGKVKMVRWLIDNKLNVNARNKIGDTALSVACKGGRTEIVELLLIKGANMQINDKHNRSILHQAVTSGNWDLVEYFINAGVNTNIVDDSGDTLLHYACEKGYTTILDKLLDYGLEINVRNNDGNTLLHTASFNEHVETIEFLLERGADVNSLNKRGRSALCVAVLNRRIKAFAVLLSFEAVNPDIKQLAMRRAAAAGRIPDICELLDASSHSLDQALLASAIGGSATNVRRLLQYGANPSTVDSKGRNCLQLARQYGRRHVFYIFNKLAYTGQMKMRLDQHLSHPGDSHLSRQWLLRDWLLVFNYVLRILSHCVSSTILKNCAHCQLLRTISSIFSFFKARARTQKGIK